jgi:hypothetical protein
MCGGEVRRIVLLVLALALAACTRIVVLSGPPDAGFPDGVIPDSHSFHDAGNDGGALPDAFTLD